MPEMGLLALAWRETGFESLSKTFPYFAGPGVSWWEPFCWRCGWRPPTKTVDEYPESWKEDRAIRFAWNAATGWLERAHLHDHSQGGDESPENMVALCVLCHEEQPICRTRQEGIDFVCSQSPRHRIQFWLQMATATLYEGSRTKPGKSDALRAMLRAQGQVAIVLAEAAEKTLKELD